MINIHAHHELPDLVGHMSNTHTALGAAGERLAHILLESSGYTVTDARAGEHRGDLRVVTATGEVVRVEVKTARQGKDGHWAFQLYKRRKTDHRHSDVLLLFCVLRTGYIVPFVVPVEILADVNAIRITTDPNRYAGRLAQWRQPGETLTLNEEVQL